MSRYTTEVRWICEMHSGYEMQDLYDHKYTPDQIIAASRANIFNFAYPIYDEEHRPELESKILKHYYTREIGAETFELWRLWLNDKLNLIMPGYNKLYAAEAETLNKMLSNIDVYVEEEKDINTDSSGSYSNTENGTTNTSTDTTSRDAYSDTPQGSITRVEDNSYLSDYRKLTEDSDTDTTTSNTGSGSNSTESQTDEARTLHEYGYRGGKLYYEIMADYQDKLVNIDRMIINDLSDLFMNIW